MKTTTSAILSGKRAASFIEFLSRQGVTTVGADGAHTDIARAYSEAQSIFEGDSAIKAVWFNLDLGEWDTDNRFAWSYKVYRDGSIQLDDWQE